MKRMQVIELSGSVRFGWPTQIVGIESEGEEKEDLFSIKIV